MPAAALNDKYPSDRQQDSFAADRYLQQPLLEAFMTVLSGYMMPIALPPLLTVLLCLLAAGDNGLGSLEQQTNNPIAGNESENHLWRTPNRCGINATYVLLRLKDVDVSYTEILKGLKTDGNGTRLGDMRDYCVSHDVRLAIAKKTPDEITAIEMPIIAHLEPQTGNGHYVVVLSIKDRIVELVDGTSGAVQVMPYAEFLSQWTGYVMVTTSTSDYKQAVGIAAATLGVLLIVSASLLSLRSNLSIAGEPQMNPSNRHYVNTRANNTEQN